MTFGGPPALLQQRREVGISRDNGVAAAPRKVPDVCVPRLLHAETPDLMDLFEMGSKRPAEAVG